MAISLLAAGCSHKNLSEKVNKRPLDGVSLNQLQNRGIDGYYVFETDSPYNGEVIDYYDNQQIKYLAKIEFGFKEGLWTSWHQNGVKKMREIIPMEKRMVYGRLGIKMVEKAQKEIGSRESPMAQLLSGMEMEINP